MEITFELFHDTFDFLDQIHKITIISKFSNYISFI